MDINYLSAKGVVMSIILSVQSHVAYGYVGNCAAIPPLQTLGHEVIALNTVQFSNHTGYDHFTGQVTTLEDLRGLINGIRQNGWLQHIDAILTGYIADDALGALVLETLEEVRSYNPSCIYCCDPVMGDVGRGFFVKETVPAFFKDYAIKKADILVPNQFEAAFLSSVEIRNDNDAIKAVDILHEGGARYVFITSYEPHDLPEGQISILLSEKDWGVQVVRKPKIALDPMPNGAGDLTAASLLGHILNDVSALDALSKTAASVHDVFTLTQKKDRRELALIDALPFFTEPSAAFDVIKLR